MTRDQAILLSDKGIVPDLVINLDITRKEVMERCKANKESKNKFGYDIRILHERLDVNDENLEKLHIWYHETYGNTLNLSTKLSKGGLLFKAKKAINHVLMRKYQLPIGLITKKPTNITNLCVTEKEFLANAGEYLNFSPVALKTKGNFIMGHLFSDHIYLYNNKFYFLANEEEARDFIKAPTSIIVSGLSLETRMAPIRPDYLEVYRSMRLRKELKDYCAVSVSKGNIVKGLPDSLLYYNSKFWCFYSENELIEFAKNPKRFDQAKLPDKLPISEIGTKANDINPIRRKAKLGEATAYLEHHLGNITMRVMAQLGNQ
jgi:YHS domain-containing protein